MEYAQAIRDQYDANRKEDREQEVARDRQRMIDMKLLSGTVS
jgi:hypothetical protein